MQIMQHSPHQPSQSEGLADVPDYLEPQSTGMHDSCHGSLHVCAKPPRSLACLEHVVHAAQLLRHCAKGSLRSGSTSRTTGRS